MIGSGYSIFHNYNYIYLIKEISAYITMVLFVIPLLATAFTGVIGGITFHFVRNANSQHNTNTQQNSPNSENRLVVDQSDRKSEEVQGVQLNHHKKQAHETVDKKEKNTVPADQQQGYVINSSDANKFICPLTHQIIKQPAQLLCGHCFQKQKLIEELKKNKKCPVCDQKSRLSEMYESYQFKNMIEEYKAKRRARKLSRDRLIQDFGDDKFQFIIRKGSEDDKALSDTEENSSDLPGQIKIHKINSVQYINYE